MNVLICTPFGPSPHRIHPLTQKSIDALGCASVKLETTIPVANHLIDLCAKYNQASKLVLNGGYDAMLHIDADMVVPVDTLDRLTAVDSDVAYGLYVMRTNPSHWLCWQDGEQISDHEAVWGKVVTSTGAGMGCTLIRRNVLERIEFRTDGVIAGDWNLAQDCWRYGFSQAHDLGCIVGHIDNDKVLYPDPDAPKLYRAEKLN